MPKTHAFRLKPGEDLKKEIESYVKAHNIHAGCIMTGVGSLTGYHIRFANQQEGSRGEGYFEIVSLSGILSANGSHLHISISDDTGRTIGGHLLDGNIIYTTAEIMILESKHLHFDREDDPGTSYKELVIKKK